MTKDELLRLTNVEYNVYRILTGKINNCLSFFDFINQLVNKGATKEEFDFLDHLIEKYDIKLFTLKDIVLNNNYLKQKKHLWKLMEVSCITEWDAFIQIESIDKFREIIPGITNSEYVFLVVLYTLERQYKNMPVDPYWSSVINRIKEKYDE